MVIRLDKFVFIAVVLIVFVIGLVVGVVTGEIRLASELYYLC